MNNNMYQLLMATFRNANNKFLRDETDNIMTGVSERNLCGALMLKMAKELEGSEYSQYHVDIEYNRNLNGKIKTIVGRDMIPVSITCDLIVHSRGKCIAQDNLIALEMKRSGGSREDRDADKLRLKCLTKDSFDDVWSYDGQALPEHVCRFVVGIFYLLNVEQRCVDLTYYHKGKSVGTERVGFATPSTRSTKS